MCVVRFLVKDHPKAAPAPVGAGKNYDRAAIAYDARRGQDREGAGTMERTYIPVPQMTGRLAAALAYVCSGAEAATWSPAQQEQYRRFMQTLAEGLVLRPDEATCAALTLAYTYFWSGLDEIDAATEGGIAGLPYPLTPLAVLKAVDPAEPVEFRGLALASHALKVLERHLLRVSVPLPPPDVRMYGDDEIDKDEEGVPPDRGATYRVMAFGPGPEGTRVLLTRGDEDIALMWLGPDDRILWFDVHGRRLLPARVRHVPGVIVQRLMRDAARLIAARAAEARSQVGARGSLAASGVFSTASRNPDVILTESQLIWDLLGRIPPHLSRPRGRRPIYHRIYRGQRANGGYASEDEDEPDDL